jgi:hypothetical protein
VKTLADRSSYGERADVTHHETFLFHGRFRWLKIALLLSALSLAAFWYTNVSTGFQLEHSGSTVLGYTLGTIGALIIVWLTFIGVRKRAMTSGHWSLKAWLSAHVYLGLSLIIIVTLHSGLHFGFDIHTLAYVLMLAVIGSGMVGAIFYMYLPVRLSKVRGDMTKKQMLEIIRSLDARILNAAQPLDRAQAAVVQLSLDKTILVSGLTRRLTGFYSGCGNRLAMTRLKRMQRKAAKANEEALNRISGLLARKQEILTKARRYARIRAFLEIWLYVHVPMTFALLAALTAHILSVFFL